MSIDPKSPCDLCALEVGSNPHLIHTIDKDFVFCCEGCVGIFKMINEVNEIDPNEEKRKHSGDTKEPGE